MGKSGKIMMQGCKVYMKRRGCFICSISLQKRVKKKGVDANRERERVRRKIRGKRRKRWNGCEA